jgi:hypothetical protein
MNQVKDFHREAMRLVDEAESARRNGNGPAAREPLRQAFDHERQAADLVAGDLSLEPTRSVLHLKGSGMRWVEEGAATVAALRALYLSGGKVWDGFWANPTAPPPQCHPGKRCTPPVRLTLPGSTLD